MKLNVPLQFASLVCLLLPLFGCSDRPENVPSDTKMVSVMADLEMAQAYIQNKGYRDNTPETRDKILEYVLEKNDMTREDFDSTISWYGRHIDIYDDLYAKVDKELARREAKISGNNIEVLTNDLWPYIRHLVISSKGSGDNLIFSIPAEEMNKGDLLTWKFRLNGNVDGSAFLGVKYETGKISFVNQSLGNNNIEVNLQTDSASKVKEILGNVRLKGAYSFVGLDSLSLSVTPFDSTLYYRIHSVRNFYGPIPKRKSRVETDSLSRDKDTLKMTGIEPIKKTKY